VQLAGALERVEQFGVVDLAGLQPSGAVVVDLALDEAAEARRYQLVAARARKSFQTSSATWTRAIRSGVDASAAGGLVRGLL
jgi:hypothetical protein